MKKTALLVCMFMMFSTNLLAQSTPPITETTAIKVTFARDFQYTHTPTGGTERTDRSLDIAGQRLFLSNANPTVFLGDHPLTILYKGALATPNRQSVIAKLPDNLMSGTYRLFINNDSQEIIYEVKLSNKGVKLYRCDNWCGRGYTIAPGVLQTTSSCINKNPGQRLYNTRVYCTFVGTLVPPATP